MFCSIQGIPELKGGYGVLAFVILFIVTAVVCLAVKAFKSKKSDAKAEAEPDEGKVEECENEPAPGRSGEMTLYNVTEREAALVMAIVADKLQKPINTLEFVSIRKITEEKK